MSIVSMLDSRTVSIALPKRGLDALARSAGIGEVDAMAQRALEQHRGAIEMAGWLVLREVSMDDRPVVRFGLLGPGGIAAVVAGGPVPRFEQAAEADRQARALAESLGIDADLVMRVVTTFESSDTANGCHLGGLSFIVVGDEQLQSWLTSLPAVIDEQQLESAREAVAAHAEREVKRQPLRLPTTPHQG